MKPRMALLLGMLLQNPALLAGEVASIESPEPVAWLDAANNTNTRLLVWSAGNGEHIYAQRVDARSLAALGAPLVIGGMDFAVDDAWRIAGEQTTPAVAANSEDGTFLVLWQAQLADVESGAGLGTELVGRRIIPATGEPPLTLGPLTRFSHLDDDSDASAGTDARSAPAIAHNAADDSYLVAWMHWPAGRAIEEHDGVRYTSTQPVIAGQMISHNGERSGDGAVLDDQPSPDADTGNGGVQRLETDVLHLSLSALQDNQPGYLLLWSDASQRENGQAMLFSRMIPADLSHVVPGDRTAITDSSSTSLGVQRVALARAGNGGRYFAAFEDGAGTRQLAGVWLDSTGNGELPPNRMEPRFITVDRIGNEDRFLLPDVLDVPASNRVVVQAVIGNRGIDDNGVVDANLVYVTLDGNAAPGADAVSEARIVAPYFSPVTGAATRLHATGELVAGEGFFNAIVDAADRTTIRLHVTELNAAQPEPGPEDPKNPREPDAPATGGGGAGGAALLLAVLLVRGRGRSAACKPHELKPSLPMLDPGCFRRKAFAP